MRLMPHVSRSLIALMVATVAFFALWLVALQPSSSNSTGKSGGVGQLQSAINAAKASAAAQNRAAAAGGNTVATTPAATAAHTAAPAKTAKPATAAHTATPAKTAKSAATAKTPKPTTAPASKPASTATASQRLNVVDRAVADHKVLALLFYNPAAPDDQAVRRELSTIPTSGGRVVKLAVPLSELTNYPVITNQVLVESSPTLVIVDRSAQAFTLVGFADQFEIAHRVLDALSMS